MSTLSSEKWTELEHLPQWDEKFYHVYTARKHGKWVMLKTLRPEYKDDPRFRAMIEKEFDVRYNLAHPHIVMINDYEEVPQLGMCIITDDVYGRSLRSMLDHDQLTADHLHKITTHLIDAIDYIQRNHIVHMPIRPETVIFTDKIGNLKLIDVGFDQQETTPLASTREDIRSFGMILREALDHLPDAPDHLHRVAQLCISDNPREQFADLHKLRMAIARHRDTTLYSAILLFITLMIMILLWVSTHPILTQP